MTEIYRDLRPNEREECLNLWLTVWPGDNSSAYFRRYFYGDVDWLPYYTRVAECDGRLVSAVHICKRTVACGEFSLTMGGIANVATLPEYRGRGFNTRCLKSAIEVMEADAMDFALLFTGINAYYRKFGFVDLPRLRTAVRIRSDYRPFHSTYAVREAATEDMPAIRRIYEMYNRNRPIAVQRSEAYWRDWLCFDPGQPPSRVLVACTDSGDVAGYVTSGAFNSAVPYDAENAEVSIIELCATTASVEEEEVVTRCLLNEVIARLPLSQSRRLVMEIAVTPVVTRALEQASGPAGIEQSVISSGMARLLHRDNLLQSVCMCSSERWRNSGSPMGKLVFETPYGQAWLDASGALPRMAAFDADGIEAASSISHSDLFCMLFGSLPPNQTDPRLAGEAADLLSALFLRRDMVFWGADGF